MKFQPIQIQSWIHGYRVLRDAALTGRGAGARYPEDRSPRTTGLDILAITGLFDSSVRAFGTRDLRRHWFAICNELATSIISATEDTYASNDLYWAELANIASHLEAQHVPRPPDATWDSLARELAEPRAYDADPEPRNGSTSGRVVIAELPATATWDEMALAQYKYLSNLRGSDPGTIKLLARIPRTTNSDVVQLATYWSGQLARVGVHHFADVSYRHVTDRWLAAVADVDRIAKGGDPDATYRENPAFWYALITIAIQVAVTDEAPSRWTLYKEAVKERTIHLPDALASVAHGAARALGEAGHQVVAGVLSAVAKPLLLVGGGIVGLWLLLRSDNTPTRSDAR